MTTPYQIETSQASIHCDLEAIVRKHQKYPYQKPIAEHAQSVWQLLASDLGKYQGRLILDTGCGTAQSTHYLQQQFPEHLIVACDKSLARLQRNPFAPWSTNQLVLKYDNVRLCRVESADFMRLCAAASCTFTQHYLLYPNPWPKAKHVMRRWHGHPVFPDLLAISQSLHVRSNWQIYIEEFAQACALFSGWKGQSERLQTATGITAFEQKYLEVGEPLYSFRAQSNA